MFGVVSGYAKSRAFGRAGGEWNGVGVNRPEAGAVQWRCSLPG